ncbi:MAG: hypothetical protein QXT67_08995, partial [Candidatus Bathyarchaeia archaeon]
WKFVGWRLREHIDDLFHKQDLTKRDTREGYPEFPAIAFADELGAYYYALHHNYKPGYVPLVIRARLDIQKKYIYIDGRDFLYTVFGLWDKKDLVKIYGVEKAYYMVSEVLKKVYGSKVLKYFERTLQVQDSDYRIAMCDLAVHDLDIVLAHACNKIVIRGRYNVTFRAAFFVEAPIKPEEIVEIFEPDPCKFDFTPDIDLYTWL